MRVGLHAHAWLYVLRMPPRSYWPDFVTLDRQGTRYGARQGPKLEPRCSGVFTACPAGEGERKTRGRMSQKWRCKKKNIWHRVMYTPYIRHSISKCSVYFRMNKKHGC